MEKMWKLIKKLVKEEEGLEMVEYAVAAGLLTVILIGLWVTLGEAIGARIQTLITSLTT